MDRSKEWYAQLRKPGFAPPAWLFGPVWSGLYLIIAISFITVFIGCIRGQVPLFIGMLFLANLVFNLLYSPIQFYLRDLALATFDILFVLATLGAALIAIYPAMPWVTWVNIPYLLWVAFASVLQCSILVMNRGKWR